MKPNVIVALLVGLVLGFVGGRVTTGPSTKSEVAKAAPNSPAAPAPAGRRPVDPTVFKVPIENSPTHGSADALVTVVEFSDYECPFCSRANVTIEKLQEQYGKKLRVVMKQNPLSFHPRAKPAAIAAMAAGEQGKYWEYHAKLFANQKKLDDASLEQYAKELGLNLDKWKAELSNPKFQDIITRDQALAGQLGASGTPAFFINGRFLSGAQPIANFQALIDEELVKAENLVKSGVPASQVYAKIIEKGSERAAPKAQPQQPAAKVQKVEIPSDSPSFGPANAKVTIVEWSDFECPFCSRVGPTLSKIKETYAKDVRVVFRHQPLPFHANAKLAAEASHAAHEQGKFWEYHDKLFANQKAMDRASLEKYAQELGLNVAKFKAALDSGKFKAKVEADMAAGNAVGANGTPTFFINGREFVGAQPFEAFKRVIDEEIGKADKLLAAGTKPEELYAKLNAENVANAPTAPAAAPGAPAEPPVQKVDVGNAPVKGDKNAPVTIVAFSDFECPFCSRVVPTLKQLEDQYGGKIKVAFKNQPLPFHANAKLAAAAALAAHEQGKFWEYHDKLFANQRALDRASLEKYAQELGLNVDKFKAALDQGKFNAQIEADMAQASSVGASGTPTFFINGRTLVGAQPVDAFKRVIDEELKKLGGAVADSK
ncbi:DsbA family protein [Myxococcus xanthus]|uniref:Thioredoxin domain-containing protein n=1 Tax=Myxococcus xanthus TaxID=34 RepID=A0A7Y4IMZ1_MYXXA|nr:thioredoxin domain-containing protein [Myxococcus xanthus]NOJ82232.1 thioredoxin domain-containing protein [Myxococcus xanthus]NOJ89759.1 thioredoxin domain-containing protein [Myxococcus xanthus]